MKLRARGEKVREYILQQVAEHPGDITRCVAEHFGITRQAANAHLQRSRRSSRRAIPAIDAIG